MDLASIPKLSNHPNVLDIDIMQEHSVSIKKTLTAITNNSKMYHGWIEVYFSLMENPKRLFLTVSRLPK